MKIDVLECPSLITMNSVAPREKEECKIYLRAGLNE